VNPDADVYTETRIHRKTLRKTQENILIPTYTPSWGPIFKFSLPREAGTPALLSVTPLTRAVWNGNTRLW